jgi:hypothetical protein
MHLRERTGLDIAQGVKPSDLAEGLLTESVGSGSELRR